MNPDLPAHFPAPLMNPDLPDNFPAPLVWADVQLLLADASPDFLRQAAVLHIVVPGDAPAGTQLYVPVAGAQVLGEHIYATDSGLCPAKDLGPAEFQAVVAGEIEVALPAGQLVLTNVQYTAPEAAPNPELNFEDGPEL